MEEFVTKIHPKIQVEIFGQNFTSFTGALQAGEQFELAHRAAGISLDPMQTPAAFVPNNESDRTPSPIRPPKVEQQSNQPSISQNYRERTERQSREPHRTGKQQERMPTRELVKMLKERMQEKAEPTTPDKVYIYDKEHSPTSVSPTND